MIYLQLFCSFLQIGLFSFGGGYASLPLIEDQVTNFHHWMTVPEFTDLITISQMTPGPIAVNSATFVGFALREFPALWLLRRDVCFRPASSSLFWQVFI